MNMFSALAPKKIAYLVASFSFKYVVAPGDCWLWRGNVNRGGYGWFRAEGKMFTAHRLAYFVRHGDCPEGLNVLHRCDVRRCVNPDHLFAGTQAKNLADMVAKGRAARQQGELHGHHVLTEVDVREIFVASGTHASIGARYGVTASAVWDIKHRKKWKHLGL